jgi:hypothetical protein
LQLDLRRLRRRIGRNQEARRKREKKRRGVVITIKHVSEIMADLGYLRD